MHCSSATLVRCSSARDLAESEASGFYICPTHRFQSPFVRAANGSEGYAFQYPKSLNDFYSKYKKIKPLVTLISLQEDQDELCARSEGTPRNVSAKRMHNKLRASTIKTCYIMKVKAKNSKVRIRGRCVQSNRPRSVSRLLRLSRIRIRALALEGNIAGCTRAT